MKNVYKPMMFQTEMVQGMLKGIKKITRRTNGLDEINSNPAEWRLVPDSLNKDKFNFQKSDRFSLNISLIKSPWQVGDIIWVRETVIKLNDEHAKWHNSKYYYKADNMPIIDTFLSENNYKWIPAVHMKKEACRLFLKVKNVRAERLQSISEKDSIAEGVSDRLKNDDLDRLKNLDWVIPSPFSCHQFGFLALWCKLYGVLMWLKNPWVWVIEFEKIDKPLDFI